MRRLMLLPFGLGFVLGRSGAFVALLCLLAPISIAGAATGETFETREGNVEVRSHPGSNAPVIMVLEYGRKLKELRRSGEWIKVIIYGTTGQDGWVREETVGPLQPETPRTVPDNDQAGSQPQTLPKSTNPDFTLVISGSSQAFRAVCTVVDGRGKKQRISIKGQGPRSYGLDGEATNCRVDRVDQHAGPLMVELYARISSLPLGTNSTSDAFGCVRVRSDGPWGKAYGRRCSRVIRKF
ncbi:MAG: SH3 domain-containing protein [Alphaproteobacteria bacterium]|nr:SH3 domain-containing protein [Alphaproteobacteria bacterium]